LYIYKQIMTKIEKYNMIHAFKINPSIKREKFMTHIGQCEKNN